MYVVAAAAAATLVAAANSAMLGLSRLAYSLSTNRQIPSAVGRLHPTRATPYVLIAIAAVIAAALTIPQDLELLVGKRSVKSVAVGNTPLEVVLDVDGQRVLFTHGHQNDSLILRRRWLSELGIWLGGWIRRLGLSALYRLFARIDQGRGGVSLDGGSCLFQRWAIDVAAHRDVDVVVTGHTHLPTSAEHGSRLFLNSGTCSDSQISFLSLDTRRGCYGVHASY